MKTRCPTVILHHAVLLAAILALVTTPFHAFAGTVYKYRDEKGAITFSDTPPAHTSKYEEIHVKSHAPSDPQAHRMAMEQMTQTSDRLQADRLLREKSRENPAPLPPFSTVYPAPEQSGRGVYLYPGYPHYPRPPRPIPPYRIDNSRDSLEDKLRTPIKIPSFGSGERLRDR